jgi:bifunctional DNA-binding transcriptional regulator/antitoxin component of YhaV-PrlF toxin-antitoxin module
MTHLVKTTSKGQVTLPIKWRNRFKTNRYYIKEKGDSLVISPIDLDELDEENWETIFDARRDNNGKGVSVDVFMKALKKTL